MSPSGRATDTAPGRAQIAAAIARLREWWQRTETAWEPERAEDEAERRGVREADRHGDDQ